VKKHDAHVAAWLRQNDFDYEWHNQTLGADHWFSLADVAPDAAAMLLCRFNPHEGSIDDARQATNDETGPDHLTRLVERFEDFGKSEPRPRSLIDWLNIARDEGLKHHSWIGGYVQAMQELGVIAPRHATPHRRPDVATSSPAPVVAGNTADTAMKKAKVRTLREAILPYMRQVFAAGQYATAKEFYKALRDKAGQGDSPFERGEGTNLGGLFVREFSKPLALKTVCNKYWPPS
jgi:hypothetical protein